MFSSPRVLVMALVLMVLAATGDRAVAQGDQEQVRLILAAGDSLAVRFKDPFCLPLLEAGNTVEAVVVEDKRVSSRVVIAEGTPVKVKVESMEGNGRKGKPGRMVLSFEEVQAVDGLRVPLMMPRPLDRKGGGRNIVAKVLTFFLIKGHDPCVGPEERFYPHFAQTLAVYVPE